MEGSFCDLRQNVTQDEYARLYEVSLERMRSISFVGVLERMDMMKDVFAKLFGVTAPLPELETTHPNPCMKGDLQQKKLCRQMQGKSLNLTADAVQELDDLVSYDRKLWCDMSATLTAMAGQLSVSNDGDAAGLAKVDERCQPTSQSRFERVEDMALQPLSLGEV